MGLSRSIAIGTTILAVTAVVHAEEPKTTVAPLWIQPVPESGEDQIFDKLLAQYKDLTYEQLKAEMPPQQYLNKLSFDPTSVKYADRVLVQLKLNTQEQQQFKQNGFVSVDHDQRYSFGSAYYAIYTRDLPVLITTDSILHAMHRSYDAILMELESALFVSTIEEVLAKCHEELERLAEQNRTPDLLDHYRDVDLYVTVARNLLAGAGAEVSSPPDPGGGQERDEWKGELLVQSKLKQDTHVLEILRSIRSLTLQTPDLPPTIVYGSNHLIDYSQFRPRGHYTKATVLKRYFRTLMWLGRADCGWNISLERELKNAVLLSELVARTDSTDRLRAMDAIINFMVGTSDNLRVFDLMNLLQEHKISGLEDLSNTTTLDILKNAIGAGKYAQQRIRSQVIAAHPLDPAKAPTPVLFQMFGQRFVLDSFVLSKVVYDEISYHDVKVERYLPTGLDVMAALGNKATIPLLASELTKYPYSANLKASRILVESYQSTFWKSSLYNIWLDTLRVLDDDMSQQKHIPQVMRTPAWQMKQLQTQLASWAELRHDTILYAKQSHAAFAICEYPAGYVEPYPHFYAKVGYFAEEAARLLGNASFSSTDKAKNEDMQRIKAAQITFLKKMASHLGQLEALATKELAAQSFSREEQTFLKKTIDIRGGGSGPPRYDGSYCDLFYGGGFEASKWDPTVADVHTDPNSGQVLETGVGDANLLVAAIDNEKDRMVYVGPVFSYYEFTQPASRRLTDEEWQSKISGNTLPPRPAWTSSFQGPREKRDIGQ